MYEDNGCIDDFGGVPRHLHHLVPADGIVDVMLEIAFYSHHLSGRTLSLLMKARSGLYL